MTAFISDRNRAAKRSNTPSMEDEKYIQSLVHVSRETMEQFQIYVDLLVEWQKKTNLIANSTVPHIWRRHIADSIQCKTILPQKTKWLDIGTGAGFPGIVLAILGTENQDFTVDMVESNNKKCTFLRRVIRETGINASVTSARIESVTKQFEDCDVVTARALANLDKLFSMTHHWIEGGAVGLFAKGRDYLKELEDCRGLWEFDLVKHQSQIEDQSVLLEIHNLKRAE